MFHEDKDKFFEMLYGVVKQTGFSAQRLEKL